MSESKLPYINRCGFCEQGLIRFCQCDSCDKVIAICDECELEWSDIGAVHNDPATASTGAFPACPACGNAKASWTRLNRAEVERMDLTSYVAGESP